MLLRLILLLFSGFGLEVCAKDVDPCQDRLSSAQIEHLGPFVLRMPNIPGDGFGDYMNAFDLIRQMKKRWPRLDISVVIEKNVAYRKIKERFAYFDIERPINTIGEFEVFDGESEEGRARMQSSHVQLFRLPAVYHSERLEPGHAPYNIYIEEPGAPEDAYRLVSHFPRGQWVRHEERLHLRINPGLSRQSFGVLLPQLRLLPMTRMELLKELAQITSIAIPSGMSAKEARWVAAYRHSLRGLHGADYYWALSEAAAPSTFVIDFSRKVSLDFNDRVKLAWRLWQFGIWARVQKRFNHLETQMKSQSEAGRPTIVHAESVPHRLLLDLMQQSEFPVLVTGTQSLFEAISLGVPFVYDLLPWKLELAYGMCEQAVLKFDYDDAKFLVGVLIGDTKSLRTREDYVRLREDLEKNHPRDWRMDVARRKNFLVELFRSVERQDLVRRFSVSLQSTTNLLDRLEDLIVSVMAPGVSDAPPGEVQSD